MFELIKKISFVLNLRHKINLALTTLLTFVISIFETLGIGLIAIFVSLLGDIDASLKKAPTIVQSFFQDYNDLDIIVFSLVFIVLFFVIKNILIWFFIYFLNLQKFKVSVFILEKLLNKYLNQKYIFFIENDKSKIINNLREEATRFCGFLFSLFHTMKDIALFIFLCAGILIVNFNLSILVMIAMILFSFLVFRILKKKLKKLGEDQTFFTKNLFKFIIETLEGIRLIKLRNLESIFFKKVTKNFLGRYFTNLKQNIVAPIPRLFIEILGVSGLCGAIYYLILQDRDLISILPILTFLALSVVRMVPAVAAINQNINALVIEANSVDIIYSELSKTNVSENKEKDYKLIFNEKEKNKNLNIETIKLSNISYKYPSNKFKSLDNISLEINKNEILGVIGASGSGKSTLSDILTGLLKPTSGEIVINNTIGENDISKYQGIIGYVPQNNFILDNDLNYNIVLTENQIDEQKLKKSIEMSELSEYQTIDGRSLGEDGLNISGGQKQRIGIARVFYQEPKIFIFDEATSAIDIKTEDKIMNNLKNSKLDKIIVIIAHRLSTLNICDKLLILENGKISDHGKKSEIIKRNIYLEKYLSKNKS